MRVSVMLDRVKYSDKPSKEETAKISNRIREMIIFRESSELEISDLGNALTQGQTCIPAVIGKPDQNGEVALSGACMLSQQVFFLDFDKNTTIEEQLNRAKELNIPVNFCYTSFSHLVDKEVEGIQERFRFVFALPIAITDYRVRQTIQVALMRLFPECDRACVNANRLFFGGRELIYTDYSATVDLFGLIKSYVTYESLNLDGNGARNFKSFCASTGLNMINGLPQVTLEDSVENDESTATLIYIIYRDCGNNVKILKFNFGVTEDEIRYKTASVGYNSKRPPKLKYHAVKKERKSQRNFDFDALRNRCRLYREFITGERWCYHSEIFGLMTSLLNVEGGEDDLIEGVNSRDEYRSEILEREIYSVSRYGYEPMQCNNFCPYKSECEHKKNPLQQVDNKRGGLRLIESYFEKDLAVAEVELDLLFNEALEAQNNKIHIIKAPTGIGKTKLYTECNLDNTMIVVPTHKLLEEVASKLEARGVAFVKAGKRPIVPERAVEARVKALLERGAHRAAREELESYVIRITYQMNKEERDFTCEEKAIVDYLRIQKQLPTANTILATHEKMLYIKNRNIKTVIVDEDIMMDSVFNRGAINVKDFDPLISEAQKIQDFADREALVRTLDGLKLIAETSAEGIVLEMPTIDFNDKKQRQLDKLIADNFQMISSNLIDFINCDFYEKINGNTIKFISNRAQRIFEADKKYILFSATASEKLYKLLCPSRIIFNDVGLVSHRGKICQYAKKSFSRYDYRQNPSKFEEEVKKLIGELPIITYKMLLDSSTLNIAKVKADNGRDYPLYFGATAGIDGLKGMDIAIVGTPHLTNDEYLLLAKCLGLRPKLDEQKMEYRAVIRNGYEFWFFTFEHELMQEIQLWLIESELMQAVGRARALREDCNVIVLSNLPLEISEIVD